MANFYGFNPPFIGGSQNVLSRQEDIRLIKNDILQLLYTEPGERVMRPNFGVPLRSSVFSGITDVMIDNLRDIIENSIVDNEPRVIVNNVSIVRDDDNLRLNIAILATLRRDPTKTISIEQFVKFNG